MNKICIVLSGVSGSGKTEFAEVLACENSAICCADDYFSREGEYKFDASKLKNAHQYCKDQFLLAIERDAELILVANTNTSLQHCQYYLDKAEDSGYKTFYLCVLPWRKQLNSHGLDDKMLDRQAESMKSTIATLFASHVSNQKEENE